jgi:hypothetical protein
MRAWGDASYQFYKPAAHIGNQLLRRIALTFEGLHSPEILAICDCGDQDSMAFL